MINTVNWYQYSPVRSRNRLLCPTPFVYSERLYLFYGEQTEIGSPANLTCSVGNPDQVFKEITIEYADPNEHAGSLGNLPNYIYIGLNNEIVLICAEFSSSSKHKHQLIAHAHRISFLTDKILIFPRKNFPFFDYRSENFHTLAGMSFFKDDFFVAEGSEWFMNANELTPVTSMTSYSDVQHEKTILPFAKTPNEIAHARPIMTSFQDFEFFAFSVRYLDKTYGSALFCKENVGFEKVRQKFWIEDQPYAETELAYLFPFEWSDELWCIATRDFRGTLGFEIFKGVINE